MMNISFQMPSWKTGLQKRLARITLDQIRDVILMVLFFALLIFMMVIPVLLALYAPPTADFTYLG
jgi:hypothetical protein